MDRHISAEVYWKFPVGCGSNEGEYSLAHVVLRRLQLAILVLAITVLCCEDVLGDHCFGKLSVLNNFLHTWLCSTGNVADTQGCVDGHATFLFEEDEKG